MSRSPLCLCLAVLLALQGCASYKPRPAPTSSVEAVPAPAMVETPSPDPSPDPPPAAPPLGRIGIAATMETLEPLTTDPPAGWAAGFGRGALAGAGTTVIGGVAVGFAPLMGGNCAGRGCSALLVWALGWTAVGLAAAPVGAVVGGIVGAVKAQSPEQVKRGKAAVINAVAEARLPDSIRDEVMRLGLERTGQAMVPLTVQGPESDDREVDTMLDIRVRPVEFERARDSTKWASAWSDLDPEFYLRVGVDVRLINPADGNVLSSTGFEEAGTPRRFTAWTADEGRAVREGLEQASSRFANRIADFVFPTLGPAAETTEAEPKPEAIAEPSQDLSAGAPR